MTKYLLCLLPMVPVSAFATITKVQASNNFAASGPACTVNLTNTSNGNLLVVWTGWSWSSTVISVNSVADSNNVLVSAVGPTVQSVTKTAGQIFYVKNSHPTSGTDTFTISFSGSTTSASCAAVEYSGADLNFPLDVTSSGYSASGAANTTMDSGLTIPINSSVLVFGAGTNDSGIRRYEPRFNCENSSVKGPWIFRTHCWACEPTKPHPDTSDRF
jgi:hypothetical protein